MSARLLLVLSLVASYPAQQNIDWKSFLYLTKDTRDKLIEEMTKNSALLLNQKNEMTKLGQATVPTVGDPIGKRPTEDDDLLFLKKMKEQTDVYQRETQAMSGGFIPAPPYIPPLPYYFIPHPNYYPLLGTRIFARSSLTTGEQQSRQQLPLRGIYS